MTVPPLPAVGPAACWVCARSRLACVKASDLAPGAVGAHDFAITDSQYGRTGELWRCAACGFLQCTDLERVEDYYRDLEDRDYAAGDKERALQADRLLDLLGAGRRGRLLDIGAGTGILVRQAGGRGWQAEGVEPSTWMHQRGIEQGLQLHHGSWPHPAVAGPFAAITIVDVIEHVPDPVGMLRAAAAVLAPDGLGLVVTPDAGSLLARLLGWRWWHYRVAHIGYFNRSTLLLALRRAGLEPVRIGRPAWYFAADYLVQRLYRYLPRWLHWPAPRWLARVTVPLNLGDSLYVVFRRASTEA